jgi:uncharacterized protein YqeY
MTLLTKIKEDQFAARKNGTDKIKISLLTVLFNEAINVGFNDGKRDTTDAEVITVIKKLLKSIDECISAGSSKGIDISPYEVERDILNTYLPQQLTSAEIKELIQDIIKHGGKPAGMKFLKENHAGKYDGKIASAAIDELLTQSTG